MADGNHVVKKYPRPLMRPFPQLPGWIYDVVCLFNVIQIFCLSIKYSDLTMYVAERMGLDEFVGNATDASEIWKNCLYDPFGSKLKCELSMAMLVGLSMTNAALIIPNLCIMIWTQLAGTMTLFYGDENKPIVYFFYICTTLFYVPFIIFCVIFIRMLKKQVEVELKKIQKMKEDEERKLRMEVEFAALVEAVTAILAQNQVSA